MEIKVKCPAKINLTLEITGKRPDGFHNIKSIMQTINLYDILTINVQANEKFEIKLSGTSSEIPYDERNLVHKAILLFFKEQQNRLISVHIEKNIPISAGLAGGSTDAAGVLWGLNKLLNKYSKAELHKLCSQLGSDLNFCLEGGCKLTTGRGEILEPLDFQEFSLSLIKPKNLGISAKEAYVKYSQLQNKPQFNMTEKFINKALINDCLYNDLETAVFNDYEELQKIKSAYPSSIMSGSGSTYFILDGDIENKLGDDFIIYSGLKSIPYGVSEL